MDEYDDFFIESIRRYNTLQMFNLENIPSHVFQVDEKSICIASKHTRMNKSELLNLQLPDKLLVSEDKEGICKGNDFKILSGLYTENLVYKIDKLSNNGKIITSEENIKDLNIYTFNQSTLGSDDQSLGNKNKAIKLNVTPWSKSEFVVTSDENNLICSKCCRTPLLQVDITAEKVVKEIKHPFQPNNCSCLGIYPCEANHIKCEVIDGNIIVVLNTHTGGLALFDLRTDFFNALLDSKVSNMDVFDERWTLSGHDFQPQSLNYFGILSNKHKFCIFDKRMDNVLKVVCEGRPSPIVDKGNFDNMKLKFNKRSDLFSISGMNSSLVDIFCIEFENNFKQVFSHRGHSPSNSSSAIVTDHIWLEAAGKEFVVSVCNNGSLNCWQYNSNFVISQFTSCSGVWF